ncbi:MAG: hypothetical protein AAFV53_22380 [Myxococcota bacterium]
MALEKEDIETLKAGLRAVRSKKAGFFYYCVAGENGDPVLLVSRKKIVKSQITTLRKTARKRKFVVGQLVYEAEDGQPPGFVFRSKSKSQVFEKHVKTFFGRVATRLKTARFSLLGAHVDPESEDRPPDREQDVPDPEDVLDEVGDIDDEEALSGDDVNEAGVKRSSLDRDLSGLTDLSGAALIDALTALSLGEINFEGIDPDGSPEQRRAAFQAQADTIVDQIGRLEALLRHVQAQREAQEQSIAEQAVVINAMVREGRGKKEQLTAKAKRGADQDQVQALLRQENEIRSLLGVAHAQLQNRFIDIAEARDEGVEEASYENLTEDERNAILSARQAQASRVDEQVQKVSALAEQIARLDQERQAERVRMRNKEAIALQKLNDPKHEERARARLAQIDARRAALAEDLSLYRLELDQMRAQYTLDQARSEQLTDLWTEQTESHWQMRQDNEDDAFYDAQLRALTDAENTYDDAADHHREIEQKADDAREEIARITQEMRTLLDDRKGMRAEHRALAERLKRVDAQLKKAGMLTDTRALEEKRKALVEEMRLLKTERSEALRAQYKTLKGERQGLKRDLGALEEQEQDAWQTMHDAHESRNASLLSDEERQLARSFELRSRAADKEVSRRQDAVDAAREAEAEAREKVDGYVEAEQAFNRARAALLAAEEKHRQVAKVAGKTRGLRRKHGRDKIDAARAALPDVEMALEAARRAFDEAQAEFAERKEEFGDDEQKATLLAEADALTRARLQTEQDLASAETNKAELRRVLAEQETRITNLSEDIYRQRRARHTELLLDTLDDAGDNTHREAIEHSQQVRAAAELTLEEETSRLIALESELQSIKEALAGQPSLEEMDELLARQRALQGDLDARAASVTAAEAAYQAAQADVEAAHRALLATARELAEADSDDIDAELIDVAQDLIRSTDALDGARERKAEQIQETITAQEEREALVAKRKDLDRRAALVDVQSRMIALVTSDKTRSTIERFHSLSGPIGADSGSVDLLSGVDQETIQKRIQSGELKPEDFHDLMTLHTRLEEQAIEMVARGATGAELEAAFAGVPNGLRPPSYRAEIARFHEVQDMLSEQDLEDRVLEAADQVAQEQLTTPEGVERLKASMGEMLEQGDEKVVGPIVGMLEEFDGYIQQGLVVAPDLKSGSEGLHGISERVSSVYGGVKAIEAIVKHARTDTSKMDPVERQMHEDALFDHISEATSAGLKLGSTNNDLLGAVGTSPVFGVLGLVDNSKQLVEGLVETGARRAHRQHDTFLQMSAKVAGSPLAGAFEESKKQEAFLFKTYGVKSLNSAAGIATDILGFFPPAAAAGAIVGLVSFVGEKVANAALNRVERKQILAARTLLDRANAGDDVAKVELFKNHALYAKGLIAHMAEQKDGFALAFVRSRGLSDDAVAGSSETIVMRYLLKKSDQSADLYDDDELVPTWRKRLSSAKQALNRVGALFEQSWWELEQSGLVDTLSSFEQEAAELAPTRQKAVKMRTDLETTLAKEPGDDQARKRHESIGLVIDNLDEAVNASLGQLQKHLRAVVSKDALLKELSTRAPEARSDKDEGIRDALMLTLPLMTRSLRNSIQTLNRI